MIRLVHYPRGFGIPSPSPFCMKAEILLQIAGTDYEHEFIPDPRKAPKTKLPYIVDNGEEIPDSTFIQAHLEKKYDTDFDDGFNEQERAIGHAFARMAEERLYWALVYSRWEEPEHFPKIAKFFFGELPPIVRNLVPTLAHRQVRRDLRGHGIGHHSRDEIYELGKRDIDAIAAQLGDNDFLLGDKPSSADAAVYPILQCLLVEEMRSPLMDQIESHKNLADYCNRCRARWFANI